MAEGGMGNELHHILYDLQVAASDREVTQLKLAASCIGPTQRKLEGVHSISSLYSLLEKHFGKVDAISILYLFLMEVKMKADTVRKLPTKQESLENWRQKQEMKFALMVIAICNQIAGDDCKQFIDLWKDDIPETSEDIETLFKHLFQRRIVWLEDVERLKQVLGNMGNQVCLEMVENYQPSVKPRRKETPLDPLQNGNDGVTTISELVNGMQSPDVQGGNGSSNNGTNQFSEQSTSKITKIRQCISKLKTVLRWIVAILTVILLGLVIFVIAFVVLYFKQTNGKAENAVDLTSLAHEGDAVYLGTVDGKWYKDISITEVPQNGDASHANNIFLIDKDPKKHSMLLVHQSHTLHQDSLSYETGSVRYEYLLDGSSVQYTMCIAYRTSGELYDSMVYVFNNAQHYWDYINEVPGAESYAICSKKLEVGTFNKSMCTPLECSILYPAFHFIAAKTGGDIFYNFSYTIHKVYLNRVDYSEVCNVFEGTNCKLDLPEATLYHVLAYTVH